MLRNFSPLILFGLAIVLSCSRDKSPTEPDPSLLHTVTIISDLENFDRAKIEKDPFHIDSVFVKDKAMHILVSYSGGCEKHDFALYCTGGINYSNPPKGYAYLGHDGHGDMCEAFLSKELIFDLTPLIEKYPNGLGLSFFQYGENQPSKFAGW